MIITVTIIAALLIGLGCFGIIYPVFPGSFAVLGGIALWGLVVRSPEGWWALGLGGVLVIAGMLAQAVLTGRTMKKRQIPNRSILWGALGAVIGMFVIPVVGLFIGFGVALLASEAFRSRGDYGAALANTGAALKSMGVGMVVEFACALAAGTVFTIAVLTYFFTL
ncbi:MAG: DUF456 domain-containing protein [Rothia sp. (in: high G+C Gram-positive bacteria)]|nr:DUF456 domain-containing protein [Rothia sp. (in: high G+C Gram-positive bacteria)]